MMISLFLLFYGGLAVRKNQNYSQLLIRKIYVVIVRYGQRSCYTVIYIM